MSLFKAKEWWSTRCGSSEEFDAGGLTIGNVDNSSPPVNKIIVGSFEGMLRIYSPGRAAEGETTSAENLLLEANLGAPILQVEIGMFVPKSDLMGLAVLHPRKLAGALMVEFRLKRLRMQKCALCIQADGC